MHLIVLVSEMKNGQRVVTLNNKIVYVSTSRGMLEPGSEKWLMTTPSEGSNVNGCAFYCGKVRETPDWTMGN